MLVIDDLLFFAQFLVDGGGELLYHFLAQFGVGLLAAPEQEVQLDPVAAFQELDSLFFPGGEVMVADVHAQADALHLHLFLPGLFLALLLFLLVLHLAEVDQLADRGVGLGRHLNQIQALFAGLRQGGVRGHDAELFSLFADQPDFRYADLVVLAVILLANFLFFTG